MRRWGDAPVLRRYDVQSALWQARPITVAAVSDLHVCDPWSPLSALDQVVNSVLDLGPDLILLPGDFLVRRLLFADAVPAREIAARLSRLVAPLGVFASLGNHDWKDCPEARRTGYRNNSVLDAFREVEIPVLSNSAVQLGDAWLVGLDLQQSTGTSRRPVPRHDMQTAFADVPKDASTLLMAHEPDIFFDDRRDVALQISGHTHAGQITAFGWRPATPSRYGGRLAHGLHSDGQRHLIVSAGLGYTGLPIRIGAPPEIVIARIAPGGS